MPDEFNDANDPAMESGRPRPQQRAKYERHNNFQASFAISPCCARDGRSPDVGDITECVLSMPGFAFAGAVQLAKRALQGMNLALVINLLSLCQFESFEHFLHLIERMFEFFNDSINLLDGIGNCGGATFGAGFLASFSLLDGWWRGFGDGGSRSFGTGLRRFARFAWFAAARVSTSATPGTAPASTGCCGLLGSALLCFVRRHEHRLPRRI